MRLLVIEDEHKIASALKKGLEQESFSVDVAYTGTEGYNLAEGEEYDLIILDLMIPEMDGITVCKKLRENKINTPIIMLTARGELEDKVNGLNSGADDYLAKPFAFEELLARIKALLRRPQTALENKLTCADLTLDTVTYHIERNNQEITLSRKEFALLEFLLRNKNRTITKDQILSHVWDYDSDVLPNTVEQYVRYLRQKVDEPFNNLPKLIHTVRGFGYQIKEP